LQAACPLAVHPCAPAAAGA